MGGVPKALDDICSCNPTEIEVTSSGNETNNSNWIIRFKRKGDKREPKVSLITFLVM